MNFGSRAPWVRRVDTRHGDMAHGITFIMHERHGANTRAEVAMRGRKAYLDARVALTLALDQRVYGDELIAQVFTRAPPRVEPARRSEAWNRVQIFLGGADLDTAAALEAIAADIRTRHAVKNAEEW